MNDVIMAIAQEMETINVETVKTETANTEVEVTKTEEVIKETVMNSPAPASLPEIPKMPTPVKAITMEELAMAVAKECDDLVMRQTTGTSYKHLGTKVDGEVNFKKGMFYEIVPNAKGLTMNMLAYSTKQGAHLVEFRPMVEKLIGDGISIGNKGLAWKLFIKLPHELGLDGMVKSFKKFHEKINPTIEEIRKLVVPQGRAIIAPAPVPQVVSTPAPVAEVPVVETPAPVVEAPVQAPVQAPVKIKAVNKASKKSK